MEDMNWVIKRMNPLNSFAHILLATSLQNHFMTYHNSGLQRCGYSKRSHYSKKRAGFYHFAIQSQIGGYFKTWKLEREKLQKQGKSSFLNPMILLTLIPWSLQAIVFIYFGWITGTLYLLASIFGISMLESQNYFSHYGLTRNKKVDGSYERVKAHHSWNSDHLLGRVLLFE